jgi:hypothetical protein
MYSTIFSRILKKSQLQDGRISFLECWRAAVLARALRIYAPKDGRIFLNTFDGQALIRMGEVLKKYDLQHLTVIRLSGGPGYVIEMRDLHKALRQ